MWSEECRGKGIVIVKIRVKRERKVTVMRKTVSIVSKFCLQIQTDLKRTSINYVRYLESR